MIANPFVSLWEQPILTLTAAAYAFALVAALVATWYALGRNLMTLYIQNKKGGWKYPPLEWALRAIAVPLVLAVDCLLLAAFVWVIG